MIEESPYSVFDVGCQTITNTVNCQGVMGAGLALEFRLRHPTMYDDYVERCGTGAVSPGRPYLYQAGEDLRILNFPTKKAWRLPSRIEWVTAGLDEVAQNIAGWGITSLALPKLGASHGGLDWPIVRSEIISRLSSVPIRIVLCLDTQPHPEGLEARMLSVLNSREPSALEAIGVKRAAAARVAQGAPYRRVREVAEVEGVGKSTYEKLFEGFRAPNPPRGRQQKLSLD
jgi:O-acetyl-ADP-ribose deacetylase (regulator of RNase III)